MKRAIVVAATLVGLSPWGGLCGAGEKNMPGQRAGVGAASVQSKPVAILSLASYDKLRDAAAYVGKLAGNPELALGWELMLQMATQNRGLEGFDLRRPWGAVVQLDPHEAANSRPRPERLISGYAFIPVTSFPEIRKTLDVLAVPVKQLGHGVLQVTNRDQKSFFLKNIGPWMFVGMKAGALADVVSNPAGLLDDVNRRYDAAVRFYPGRLPRVLRERFVEELNRRAEIDLIQKPGEDDDAYAQRRLGERWTLGAFGSGVNELEQITLGLRIDAKAQRAYVDLELIPRPGSEAADRFAQWAHAHSAFSGFTLPNATAVARWTTRFSTQTADELNQVLVAPAEKAGLAAAQRAARSEEAAAQAKRLLRRMVDAIRDTIASGVIDLTASAVLDPQGVTVIAAEQVADGRKLEAVFGDVAEAARREDSGAEKIFKPGVDTCEDVRLHTLAIPISPNAQSREQASKLFGNPLQIVLGFSPHSVYAAAGRAPMDALKAAIRRCRASQGKSDAPIKVSAALGPLVRFIAALERSSDRQKAARLADLLQQSGGKDHVQLTIRPIERGAGVRLEVEEGALKAIAALRLGDG